MLTYALYNNMLFSLHVFECFWIFPLKLVCSLKLLWSEKMLDMISTFLNLFCKYQLSPFYLECHSMSQYPCWSFLWKIYPLLTMGCYNPLLWVCCCWFLSRSSLRFSLYIRCSYFGCIYGYKGYIFLLDYSLNYYLVTFFVSYYGLCFEVCFVWYKYCCPTIFPHVSLLGIFFSILSLSAC